MLFKNFWTLLFLTWNGGPASQDWTCAVVCLASASTVG